MTSYGQFGPPLGDGRRQSAPSWFSSEHHLSPEQIAQLRNEVLIYKTEWETWKAWIAPDSRSGRPKLIHLIESSNAQATRIHQLQCQLSSTMKKLHRVEEEKSRLKSEVATWQVMNQEDAFSPMVQNVQVQEPTILQSATTETLTKDQTTSQSASLAEQELAKISNLVNGGTSEDGAKLYPVPPSEEPPAPSGAVTVNPPELYPTRQVSSTTATHSESPRKEVSTSPGTIDLTIEDDGEQDENLLRNFKTKDYAWLKDQNHMKPPAKPLLPGQKHPSDYDESGLRYSPCCLGTGGAQYGRLSSANTESPSTRQNGSCNKRKKSPDPTKGFKKIRDTTTDEQALASAANSRLSSNGKLAPGRGSKARVHQGVSGGSARLFFKESRISTANIVLKDEDADADADAEGILYNANGEVRDEDSVAAEVEAGLEVE